LFSGASPMPFVSVTRVRVRSLWYTLPFLVDAVRTSRQARTAEGNLAVKVLRDTGNTWWTCTAWDSEASMRQFMLAKPHGPGMRKIDSGDPRLFCRTGFARLVLPDQFRQAGKSVKIDS